MRSLTLQTMNLNISKHIRFGVLQLIVFSCFWMLLIFLLHENTIEIEYGCISRRFYIPLTVWNRLSFLVFGTIITTFIGYWVKRNYSESKPLFILFVIVYLSITLCYALWGNHILASQKEYLFEEQKLMPITTINAIQFCKFIFLSL